jgi:integrase
MTTTFAHKDLGNNLKDYIGFRIDNFLNDKKARSENTFKNYKIDIEQFFQFIFDRHYSYISVEEVESITSDEIIEYRLKLQEEGKANATINRKITSVRKLFGYLESTNPKIRKAIFGIVEKMKENDTESYGVLSWEESQEMLKLAKTYKDGEKLSMLIELAVKTCYRLRVLLDLTLDHIHLEEKGGQAFHVIKMIDKGEKHNKPISKEVYNRLVALSSNPNEPIFNFSPHTVGRRLNDLVTEMKLDLRRNIKFHSLKKCGINFVFDSTGDIMLAQQQGNHKSASTTMKSYLEHQTDYSKMPSYTMGESIDLAPLEELSKEQLLELIKGATSGTQLELLRRKETILNK